MIANLSEYLSKLYILMSVEFFTLAATGANENMSSPLMWKALQLSRSIYDRILYPHIITFESDTEKIHVETRHRKLLRVHLSSCVIGSNLFCVFHFLLRKLFDPNFQNAHLTLFYVALGGFMVLHLVLTKLNISLAPELLEESCNELIKFERKLLGTRMKSIGYATKISHSKLLFKGTK